MWHRQIPDVRGRERASVDGKKVRERLSLVPVCAIAQHATGHLPFHTACECTVYVFTWLIVVSFHISACLASMFCGEKPNFLRLCIVHDVKRRAADRPCTIQALLESGLC